MSHAVGGIILAHRKSAALANVAGSSGPGLSQSAPSSRSGPIRDAFEEWWPGPHGRLTLGGRVSEGYEDELTDMAWLSWQACWIHFVGKAR